MQDKIQLIQSPIIKHSLIEMGRSVSDRMNALNLENQVATEDSIKTLKDTRSILNKELSEFEEQRKAIKNAVLTPYSDFENTYKIEIQTKYKNADNILRDKINTFEMSVKDQKKKNLIKYFEELREMEQVVWLEFDQLGIEVNISVPESKYKIEIFGKVQKIADEVSFIESEKYSAEILVEYKSSLNVTQSIKKIKDRKEAERIEEERLKLQKVNKRTALLQSLSFVYHDLTRTYNYTKDESVMISYSDVENLPEDEWTKQYVKLESKTKGNDSTILQVPSVSSPAQVSSEKMYEAKFIVTGTYDSLKALGEFLKANNYTYQNID